MIACSQRGREKNALALANLNTLTLHNNKPELDNILTIQDSMDTCKLCVSGPLTLEREGISKTSVKDKGLIKASW